MLVEEEEEEGGCGGGGYYTIVRPLIRLAQRLPAGQFVSGLRGCQSNQTSSPPQAVATKHLSCCVERFDGGILCAWAVTLRCNPLSLSTSHTHTRAHTHTYTHACNGSVKSGRTRQEEKNAHVNNRAFLHVRRGGTRRRVRGCSSVCPRFLSPPPHVTLIHRRHVEPPHQD